MKVISLLKVAGLVVLGFLAARGLRCDDDEPTYQVVEVPAQALLELKPQIELGWLRDIWWASLDRRQRAVAPGGAKDVVIDFCRPIAGPIAAGPVDSLPTVPLPQVRAALDAVRVDAPLLNPFGSRSIDLFGFTNQGDLFHDNYSAGPGDLECVVDGAETKCRSQRFGWVGPATWTVGAIGAGILIGAAIH